MTTIDRLARRRPDCYCRSCLRGPGVQTVFSGGYGISAVRAGRSAELVVALKKALNATDGPHVIIADIRPELLPPTS